ARPAAPPASAPRPALPPIAPSSAPPAAPIAPPDNVVCWVSLMPEQPERPSIAAKANAGIADVFIACSSSSPGTPSSGPGAGPCFGGPAHQAIDRRVAHELRMRSRPLDEHGGRLVARGRALRRKADDRRLPTAGRQRLMVLVGTGQESLAFVDCG